MEHDMSSDDEQQHEYDDEENSLEEDNDGSDDGHQYEDEKGEEEEDNDGSDDGHQHEDEKGEEEKETEDQRNSEMAELEKEYMELKHGQQDFLKNIKQQKDADVLQGQSIKSQTVLWDKALEMRFLLQKAYSSSNKLPQEATRSLFCELGDGVSEAYSELLTSSTRTLNSILQLQEALLDTNPSIAQTTADVPKKKSKPAENSACSFEESDEEWTRISQMHSRMSSFRDDSVDKWQRKTQVTSGAAAIRGKLYAFNKSISEQVAAYLRDPSKMIKGMQQNRSAVGVFGSVLDSSGSIRIEGTNVDDDAELIDDSDFYQYLLKEFFEAIDPSSSEMAFYAHRRLKPKKRKVVDRRASKSRKIRYSVHEKIVNFTAPQPMDIPPMASKLFENLFGRKTQNLTNAA